MPNIKISQLPYIGNPDTSAIIPLVQSGVTYKTDFFQVIDAMLIPELSSIFQSVGNITQSIFADGTSTTKYPSASAVKAYADSLVVGLLDDRGNYTPDVTSPGDYPQNGGSGPGNTIAKGDLWFIAAPGYLGTTPVVAGQSVRALVDNADPNNDADWDILDIAGWTVAPENSANKVISKAQFIADGSSIVKYPSIKAVKDYIDQEVTLQDVINNDNALIDNINAQGINSGTVMLPGVTDINAFGSNAATANQGSYINSFGSDSCNSNSGSDVNAIGTQSAGSNSGNNVQAIGFDSCFNNQGNFVSGIGVGAGFGNEKNYLNAIGFEAGKGNKGLNVSSLGYRAAISNEGNYVNALGDNAASTNQGQDVNVIGRNSGAGNQGDYVSAIGNNAALNNTGDDLNALGNSAGSNQSGKNVNAFGKNAGLSNGFNNVTLLGENSSADGNFQLVFSDGTNNARINAGSIVADTKITLPTADGTMVISVNGTPPDAAGNVVIPTGASGWGLTGNAGTNPATDFVGTTDGNDLIFKTNGIERMKIDATFGEISTGNSFRAVGAGNTAVMALSSIGDGGVIILQDSTDKGQIYISNGINDATIKCLNLTGVRTHQLPDADGTYVLRVNNIVPDTSGNVTIDTPFYQSKVVLTSSQILNMDTTPITAVPAPPAGKAIFVTNIAVKTTAGTGYTISTDIALVPAGSGNIICFTQGGPLSVANSLFSNNVTTSWFSPTPSSVALRFKGSQGVPPSGGTCGATIVITYSLIDL